MPSDPNYIGHGRLAQELKESPELRTCTICKRRRPMHKFIRGPYLKSTCHECRDEHVKLKAKGLKRCRGCQQIKPIATGFYLNNGRHPRPYCRPCMNRIWNARRRNS